MANPGRTRALNKLNAAQAEVDRVRAAYAGWVHQEGGEADRARFAAHNALTSAWFPFLSGKYEMPEQTKGFLS